MTTVVKVEAHCDPETTEVHITKTGVGGVQETVLQDGESAEETVYDLEMIRVREVPKAAKKAQDDDPAGDSEQKEKKTAEAS